MAGGIDGHAINLQVSTIAVTRSMRRGWRSRSWTAARSSSSDTIRACSRSPAGPVYKQNGLAAVTGTATADPVTQDNPFYYRTTFTNTGYAAQFGRYVGTQLGAKRVSIIQSNDSYGQTIADGFTQGFPGTIVRMWQYDDAPDKRDASRKQILDALAQTPDAGTVMFAMLGTPGSRFVIDIKRRGCRHRSSGPTASAPAVRGPVRE